MDSYIGLGFGKQLGVWLFSDFDGGVMWILISPMVGMLLAPLFNKRKAWAWCVIFIASMLIFAWNASFLNEKLGFSYQQSILRSLLMTLMFILSGYVFSRLKKKPALDQ